MFLLLHSIRESFELATGAVQFDLGSGDHAYKRVVCNVGWDEGIGVFVCAKLAGIRVERADYGDRFRECCAAENGKTEWALEAGHESNGSSARRGPLP